MSPVDPWLANLLEFESNWLERLKLTREVQFHASRRESAVGHSGTREPWKTADAFASSMGYRTIEHGWRELASPGLSRDPVAEIAEAISRDLVFPSNRLIDEDAAQQCASAFVESFKSASRTVLSNRSGSFSAPISNWTLETAFLAFDNSKIALLLFRAED